METINNLIEKVFDYENLTSEEKRMIMDRVYAVKYGQAKFIMPGFKLKTVEIQNSEDMLVQLYYRNVDQSGNTNTGPTHYNNDQILELMANEVKKQKGITK